MQPTNALQKKAFDTAGTIITQYPELFPYRSELMRMFFRGCGWARTEDPNREQYLKLAQKESGLTLQEAIRSGRPYKRLGWKNYIYPGAFKALRYTRDDGTTHRYVTQKDCLENDWELAPIKEIFRYDHLECCRCRCVLEVFK